MILRPPGSTRTDPSFPTRRSSDLGRLTVSLPDDRLLLKADLATQSLDIIDVGPFIGYDPERLARQGKAGAIRTVGGAPRILPDAPLRVEALRNFDAREIGRASCRERVCQYV